MVSTADALAAMTPEMASGSCATSVRKNRKKAVSSVAAIEKPISDTPQTERIAVLILGMALLLSLGAIPFARPVAPELYD